MVEHWVHQVDEPRGTVIALHGFTMGSSRFDSIMLFAKQWYDRGFDVALVVLPFHGPRAPRSARFSGEHFAVPDVTRLAEAVRRAVFEIRMLKSWLVARKDQPVGMLGLSLGGYLTAVSASLEPDLAFAIPMVPPVCIGDLAWRFYQRSRHHRSRPADGSTPSFDQQELRRAFRVHSPLAHRLAIPRERVLIIAGRGDRIVPPEHPNALWQHWGEPRIHWFDGSHLAPFGRGRIVREIDRHLRRVGVL
jgi:pimeloyl-ACP methyl ester carboxylesterase